MDQLIEMYVEDRNKLNTLFLSHDHSNRNDPSSNADNDDDNQPPPPPNSQPPPNGGTNSSSGAYHNLSEPSTGDAHQPPQAAGDQQSQAKSAHKYLIETQSVPLSKMSFNLVEQINDQNSEPNTPVCRNLDRPMQRGNSDLVPSRIIATSKNTPMIRIVGAEKVASLNVLNAQFRRQLRDQLQQQQHRKPPEQPTMHCEPSSSQTTSQHIEQQQIEQPPYSESYSELPLSAHPIASAAAAAESAFDYCSRPRMPSISHSVSFPAGTNALLKSELKRTNGQCRHCTQQHHPPAPPPHHTAAPETISRAQQREGQSQRATFYRQMSYPHSSATLFMPPQSHQPSATPSGPVSFSRAALPLPPLMTTVSSIAPSSTGSAAQQPASASTFVHHPSNHPSADHI